MPHHGKGPPHKPEALKRLEGTYRPDRAVRTPPSFGGRTPNPPKELSDAAKREWQRLGPSLAGLGMLTPADKALFGVYCQAYADYWKLTAELNALGEWTQFNARSGALTPVPQVAQRKAAWEMMRQAAHKFGFSPSDRAAVDLSPRPERDAEAQQKVDWLLKRSRQSDA